MCTMLYKLYGFVVGFRTYGSLMHKPWWGRAAFGLGGDGGALCKLLDGIKAGHTQNIMTIYH